MIGDRLHRIARGLLREHTCTTVVAPAIADLQYEERQGGTWPRIRGYTGVWRALAAAIAGELADDCSATLATTHFGRGFGPLLVTLGVACTVFAPRLWSMYARSERPWHHDAVLLALTAPSLFAAMAPALALPAAATFARTGAPGSRRAALLLTIIAGTVVVGASQAARWHVTPLWFDMFYTSNTSIRAGSQDRPLWELRQQFTDQREALHARDPRARERWERQRARRIFTPIDQHETASLMLLVAPFALLGLAWSSKGRWAVGALGGGVFLGFVALQMVTHRIFYGQDAYRLIVATLWMPVMFLLLTSVLLGVGVRRPPKQSRGDRLETR